MSGPTPTTIRRTHTAGMVCLIAGLLGAASGAFLSVVEPQVPESRYSYPLAASGFIAIQVWFALQHLGLLAGQVGLKRSGLAGLGRSALWGHLLGIIGMTALTVMELLAITASDDPYPSDTTTLLDAAYGFATVAIGVGLVMVGISVRRARLVSGWTSWVPLAIGIWVFFPMTPAIAMGFLPARLAITAWMLLYAALGWLLIRSTRQSLASGTRELAQVT